METFEVFEKYLNYRPLPKRDAHKDVWESLLCGAAAGIAAKTVIAPAERVKMSFQVTPAKYSLRAAIAHGRTVVTQQGFLSLWRGHSTTILRVAPYSGFSYAIHDLSEDRFKAMLDTDVLPASYKFLAGSLGGVGGTVLTYPLDVLRVRLALGATWSSALKQGGMFQGLVPTLLGIVPYAGTAWGVKQTLLEAFPGVRGRMPNVLESVVINAIAGLMGQFVSYPLDVVRRRMQVAKVRDGCPPTLSGVWRELIRTEGFSGAGKGFTLNIIKGPIALSISLTVYDLLKAHIQRNKASASASAPAPAPASASAPAPASASNCSTSGSAPTTRALSTSTSAPTSAPSSASASAPASASKSPPAPGSAPASV
ncbi:mitochondrial carrier domain-containing protein [Ochromonadaceae sp. CCMP2298]|nr:mitochondrial carrier domain-containing protein [Ochromonadaceae sp. CCMP2298]